MQPEGSLPEVGMTAIVIIDIIRVGSIILAKERDVASIVEELSRIIIGGLVALVRLDIKAATSVDDNSLNV
jgi:hypothetical protein